MNIEKLELLNIRKHCEEEINLYFQAQDIDASHCFELFRRCFQDRDQNAWEHAYILYEPQVARWVKSHRLFIDSGEEVLYFVNRALEKMWSAIPSEKFSRYASIKHLLSYLKMCVNSVIVDHYRKQERAQLGIEKLREHIETNDNERKHQSEESELWQMLEKLMKNKNERMVLYASFILGLKPKEINVEFSDVFSNVKEIYRIKENILARLRRDQDLMKFLGKIGELSI